MAMIICEKCGNEISDKAEYCIYCSKTISKSSPKSKKCVVCGYEMPSDSNICPFCGNHEENMRVKDDEISKSKKKKRILITTILSVIVILGICAGFYVHSYLSNLYNDEKLAYKNAVKMKSMVKDPDSFTLLDEMYILKHLAKKGNVDYTYTIFKYSYTNGSEGEKSDEAVFKNDKFIVNYDDKLDENDKSYNEKVEAQFVVAFSDYIDEEEGWKEDWKKVKINVDKIRKKMDAK